MLKGISAIVWLHPSFRNRYSILCMKNVASMFSKRWSRIILENGFCFVYIQSCRRLCYKTLYVADSVLQAFNGPILQCICADKISMIIRLDLSLLRKLSFQF